MGGSQAAGVLTTIRAEARAAAGDPMSQAEQDDYAAPVLADYDRMGSPYYSTARLWDDGVIDPVDTRRVLGMALSLSDGEQLPDTNFGIFRM